MAATRTLLPGRRWHFQHGPIDCVIGAEGDAHAVEAAHEAAWRRFVPLLGELAAELPRLRQPVGRECPLEGPVARRMWQACAPFRDRFITPMAAVAGAVAQELIVAYRRASVVRAFVNNGGDIALHLAPGASLRVGLFSDLKRLDARALADGLTIDGRFEIAHTMPVRGIATSGWRGRSFSLGIADSVTVLAASAAMADAAATVIAHAVDLDDARIVRRPACELQDDSDLGTIPVTVEVPELGAAAVRRALEAGLAVARDLQARGLIEACALACQGVMLATSMQQPLGCIPPEAIAA